MNLLKALFANNSFRIFIHVLVWIGFIFGPFLLFTDMDFVWKDDWRPFKATILVGVASVILFYFNHYYSLPRFFFKKEFLKYAGITLLAVVVLFFLIRLYYLIPSDHDHHHHHHPRFYEGGKQVVRILKVFTPRAVMVLLASFIIKNYQRNQRLENEKTKAELRFLKSQVAPHFLFNTLNGLYGLAITNSNKTAEGILNLSQLMRYVIVDAQEDRVSLVAEIKHVQNYIDLQTIRLTAQTKVKTNFVGDFDKVMIAPLLLTTFIENAFKYGISTEKESAIEIDIQLIGKEVVLKVANSIVAEIPEGESSEIGLANAYTRLNFIYPNQHVLNIKKANNTYVVNLEIELE